MLQPHLGFLLSSASSKSAIRFSYESRCCRIRASPARLTASASAWACCRPRPTCSLSADCWLKWSSASRTWPSRCLRRSRRPSVSMASAWALPSRTPALRSRCMRRSLVLSSVPAYANRSSSNCRRASATARRCSACAFSCSSRSALRSSSSCRRTSSARLMCSERAFSFSPLRASRSRSSCLVYLADSAFAWAICSSVRCRCVAATSAEVRAQRSPARRSASVLAAAALSWSSSERRDASLSAAARY
mmetsp:Transcript_126137/g.356703  ORF Transcript_126137/g.356703 Transcript_126137/m.356703 type:complete len:248 (+) Transcript_126137:239-982(+)